MSTLKLAVGGLIFGSLVVGTGSLGIWQVQRYNWKISKIKDRKDELRLPPLTLDQIISVFIKNNYEKESCAQPCEIEGYFDHDRSLLIGRRGAPDGLVGEKPQGMATSPSGYYLCTVLRQDNGNEILVNRGWMPASIAEHKTWAKPKGKMKVKGMVSFGEGKSLFSPTNQPGSGVMLWTELPVMAETLKIDLSWSPLPSPIMLELLSAQKAKVPTVTPSLTKTMATDGGPLWFVPDHIAFWRKNNETINDDKEDGDDEEEREEDDISVWPMCKSVKNYESFAVMPETHAVYAVTWFSLSLFGLIASARLLRRKSPIIVSKTLVDREKLAPPQK